MSPADTIQGGDGSTFDLDLDLSGIGRTFWRFDKGQR